MPTKFVFYDNAGNELELHNPPNEKNRLQITVGPRDIESGSGGYINLDGDDIDKLIAALQEAKSRLAE